MNWIKKNIYIRKSQKIRTHKRDSREVNLTIFFFLFFFFFVDSVLFVRYFSSSATSAGIRLARAGFSSQQKPINAGRLQYLVPFLSNFFFFVSGHQEGSKGFYKFQSKLKIWPIPRALALSLRFCLVPELAAEQYVSVRCQVEVSLRMRLAEAIFAPPTEEIKIPKVQYSLLWVMLRLKLAIFLRRTLLDLVNFWSP